ncbi:hypothetical protein C8Q76DRAFT_693610 [Earliella scabrosa]|nr:hypothetical protein C8Q76DRAFT_693610 [Earliella scabrosa]
MFDWESTAVETGSSAVLSDDEGSMETVEYDKDRFLYDLCEGELTDESTTAANTSTAMSAADSYCIVSPKPMFASQEYFNFNDTTSLLDTRLNTGDGVQDSASYGDSMAGRLQDAVVEDYSHCSTDEIADVGIADHLQITSVQHCSQFPADEVVDNITSSLFASDPREREIGSVNTDPPVDGVRRSLVPYELEVSDPFDDEEISVVYQSPECDSTASPVVDDHVYDGEGNDSVEKRGSVSPREVDGDPSSIDDGIVATPAYHINTTSPIVISRFLPATYRSPTQNLAPALSPNVTACGASNYWTLCIQAHNAQGSSDVSDTRKRRSTHTSVVKRVRKKILQPTFTTDVGDHSIMGGASEASGDVLPACFDSASSQVKPSYDM